MKSPSTGGIEGEIPEYLSEGLREVGAFPPTPCPPQTSGSPLKLLPQKVTRRPPSHSLPTSCPSHEDLGLPVPPPPTSLEGGASLSPLQVVISISLSPTAIHELFTETDRRKRDNIKIVSGWGGGRSTTGSWNFLSLPCKRESFIFSKALPNGAQTPHLELLGGRDRAPALLTSQGRACHQPPKVWVRGALPRVESRCPLCPLPTTSRVSLQPSKHTSQSTMQNFGFSLRLKCFIIEKKKISSNTTNTAETKNIG